VQGSAVVAANIIITHPLIMSAATEICFFTLEILHSPPQLSRTSSGLLEPREFERPDWLAVLTSQYEKTYWTSFDGGGGVRDYARIRWR
jgi:hypothetical protein